MRSSSETDLVLCPRCGNIQNRAESCIKCGTIIALTARDKNSPVAAEPSQVKENTKVSLLDRRRTRMSKANQKQGVRGGAKRLHLRKDKTPQ